MSRFVKSVTLILAVLVVCLMSTGAWCATMIDGKPNNPYGVQLGMWGADWSDYASLHFQWARDMVGEWGHVRVSGGVQKLQVDEGIRTLAMCRAKHLIPVMTGLYVPDEYVKHVKKDRAPDVLDHYPLAAQRYGEWARRMAEVGAVVPYYEVGNEINGKWEPEAYGRFIIDVSKAMKEAMPELQVTSAGLAGNGADFLDAVLTAVPEAAEYVDCWGLHPYGINHPPAYDKDGACVKGHLWTAEALAKHGITNPRFVMTESNYELGNKRDLKYPRITDELRAEYMVEAYRTIWAPDPRVVTLTVFWLQATHYLGWDTIVLIDRDCRKSETYKALAAVPKPEGCDWMPQGRCSIRGRITDVDSGQGMERVFAYTVPGIYAAETDSQGNFSIDHVPAGSYRVHIFRDGFTSPEPLAADLTPAKPARLDVKMKRVGFIPTRFSGAESVVDGWQTLDGKVDEHFAVDSEVKRTTGASQRLTAHPGEQIGVWQCADYASAVPDRPFAAEVWVKGRGVKLGEGKGASIMLSIADSGAQPMVSSEVNLPLEGDFDWTPISVTLAPYPQGRRLVVSCRLDAAEGTVWFADPYCHYADYPVPSRAALGSGAGRIRGEVTAEKGEYMPEAIVCLRPGNIWTMTRSDGTYDIEDIPAGTYDIWAFHEGKMAVAKYGVEIENDKTASVNIEINNPPAPRQLQNGDFEKVGGDPGYTAGWMRYDDFDGIAASGWHKGLPLHPEGVQAHTGKGFAGSAACWKIKNGGMYQTIEVDPGKEYEVSCYSYTCQTEEGARGDVANRIGVDPTGGIDPNGPYVMWTPFRPSQKTWSRISLDVTPIEDRMTVFLGARQVTVLGLNMNCFDDVTVVEKR